MFNKLKSIQLWIVGYFKTPCMSQLRDLDVLLDYFSVHLGEHHQKVNIGGLH